MCGIGCLYDKVCVVVFSEDIFCLQVYVSAKLALFSLVVVPPVAAMSVVYGRYLRSITRQVQDSLASATQVSVTQMSVTQVSITQVSITQVSVTQVSMTQASATQVSVTQVSVTQKNVIGKCQSHR